MHYHTSVVVLNQPFSKRNRFNIAKEITVHEDAPETLRYFVLQTARDLDWAPSSLRTVLCHVLRVRPNPDNWSEFPNIWSEVQELMHGCDWFKVYDIVEALYARFSKNDQENGQQDAMQFADAINSFFVEEGVGWQLIDGQVVARGTETFEAVVKDAISSFESTARPTAAKHLQEALEDLSRRPQPDLPGAVYHAMGALECLGRDLADDPKATLGEILKRHPNLLPKPLDAALSQIWGYASNEARHVEEGRDISRDEAELVVGLSAALSTYLMRKRNS